MSQRPHIIVTGSTGNLGEKAVEALSKRECRITRIGHNSSQRSDVITADLTCYSEDWAEHFADTDVVLHLAADPKPVATWGSLQKLNVDLSLNVLRASQLHSVRRFVFASSNWILGGHRFTNERLKSSTTPLPLNPYGASKLFIERLGIEQTNHTGMSFLSLRIGYCQPGQNRPGPHMAFGRWGQEMWLSNEDWSQAVECACLNHFSGSAILNIMSENAGMRWDLSEARDRIGYSPVSRSSPRMSPTGYLKDGIVRLRSQFFPTMSGKPVFGTRW